MYLQEVKSKVAPNYTCNSVSLLAVEDYASSLGSEARGTYYHYQYDAANRLIEAGGVSYTWDANGNLLNDGTSTYTYNYANRLAGVAQDGVTYTYAYNGMGDRLRQTVDGEGHELHAGHQHRPDPGAGGRHDTATCTAAVGSPRSARAPRSTSWATPWAASGRWRILPRKLC